MSLGDSEFLKAALSAPGAFHRGVGARYVEVSLLCEPFCASDSVCGQRERLPPSWGQEGIFMSGDVASSPG